MAEKKEAKKTTKKESTGVLYQIKKTNGNTIERMDLSADAIKGYEARGWSVSKEGGK